MYFFTLFLFFVFSYITLTRKVSKSAMTSMLGLCVLWLILHDGLRWETGTDWDAYYETFIFLNDVRVEKGYMAILSFFRSFTDSYTVYLLGQAIFQYSVFYYIIRKYSNNPIVSFSFLYFMSLPLLGMNRQWIGMCMCFMAIPFVFKRKLLPFSIIVLLSSTIHVSCLLFFIAYFLPIIKISDKFIILSLIVSTLIGISGILNIFSGLFYLLQSTFSGKLPEAEIESLYSFSYLGAMRKYIMLFLFYLTLRRGNVTAEMQTFFKMYFVGALMFLTFSGSWLQIFVGRGAMFFSIAEIFLAPYLFLNFRPKNLRILLWFIIFVVYSLIMFRDLDNYIIISGEGRDIFNPYRCVLFL